jgi:putative two-component system response regulator
MKEKTMNDTTPKSTIMVVDDTPANLKLLEEMLGGQGHKALMFPSGVMALRAIAKNPPDLILLDIMMPEMNGFEFCQQLKADTEMKKIPVIFLSALSDTESKVKAFSMGGVDYVTKPFQFEEIKARVETHLKLRKMQVEKERQNQQLEDLVQEKVKEISASQLATIFAVSKLAESRDDETGQHIERTQTFCRILSQKLLDHPRYGANIPAAFVDNIYHASPLHDIGKVGIMDNILLKPGKLTPEEFEIMKTHTLIGSSTLQTVHSKYPNNTFLNMGIEIARSHHEKWDGSGYPDGLAGENIPLSARIMAIADVYDALRSKRPYKEPFSHQQSFEIILKGAGNHFDPVVIETFMTLEPKFADIPDSEWMAQSAIKRMAGQS